MLGQPGVSMIFLFLVSSHKGSLLHHLLQPIQLEISSTELVVIAQQNCKKNIVKLDHFLNLSGWTRKNSFETLPCLSGGVYILVSPKLPMSMFVFGHEITKGCLGMHLIFQPIENTSFREAVASFLLICLNLL